MITIMLLRAIYESTKDYDSNTIPPDWCNTIVAYGFVGREVWQTTALEIVKNMKVNFFPADFCTKLAATIMSDTPQLRQQVLNAYLISVCTSRAFLAAFLETQAYKTKRTIESKLAVVLNHLGQGKFYKCFTRSYNPQRRIRNTLLKLKNKGNAAKKFFNKIFARPPALKLKDGKQWRSKLNICLSIRQFRGLGMFGAKNFWQFFRLGRHSFPTALDRSFGEVGPGARKGLNLLFHFPQDLMKSSSDAPCALFYSAHCEKIRQKCLRHPLLTCHPDDHPHVKQAKIAVRNEFSSIEGTQFVICEHSKIVRWCTCGSCIYEWGYWASYEEHDDQENM